MATQTLKRNTRHKQTTVKVPHSAELIQVDEGMAKLLVTMWSIGVKTKYSCQGNGHLFVDQTCYEANNHRAYVLMERDPWSIGLVRSLMRSEIFEAETCSWEISFDRDPYTDLERITIYFPSEQISLLTEMIGGF